MDAHVDAHLKDYDVSDDLSMNLEPLVDYIRSSPPAATVRYLVQVLSQILTDENLLTIVLMAVAPASGPDSTAKPCKKEKKKPGPAGRTRAGPVPPAAKPAHTERKTEPAAPAPHRSRITT